MKLGPYSYSREEEDPESINHLKRLFYLFIERRKRRRRSKNNNVNFYFDKKVLKQNKENQ